MAIAGRRIVVLHAIQKQSQRLKRKDIEIAEARYADVLRRLTDETLRQYVDEQIKKRPEFARNLAEANAEVTVAVTLARLREQRGLSQRELAVRTRIKQPQIAPLERGAQLPTLSTLMRLLTAMDAQIELGPHQHCRVRTTRRGPALNPVLLSTPNTDSSLLRLKDLVRL